MVGLSYNCNIFSFVYIFFWGRGGMKHFLLWGGTKMFWDSFGGYKILGEFI